MNNYLSKLPKISGKSDRLIIGLMSGTSLDALDIALCKITGHGTDTLIDVLEFNSDPYPARLRERLEAIQSREMTDTRELTLLHTELGLLYGDRILNALKSWGVKASSVDLIASHGQTVYHAPSESGEEPHATLQIADGDHIACQTGIITISDFRQKHTAWGGEGAPLAGIFDEVLFRDDNDNRLLLNLGGIANFTWLPARSGGEEILCSDTGPANTLINEAMQCYFDEAYDEFGAVANEGQVHSGLVRYVLLEPYFRRSFPKTTGQEEFRLEYIEELMKGHGIELDPKDLVATLTAITTQSISRAVEEVVGEQVFECYVSGGGIYNETLMQDLKGRLPNARFKVFGELGLPPDVKEAAMMAFFANELVAGEGFRIPGVTEEKVSLGKISLP